VGFGCCIVDEGGWIGFIPLMSSVVVFIDLVVVLPLSIPGKIGRGRSRIISRSEECAAIASVFVSIVKVVVIAVVWTRRFGWFGRSGSSGLGSFGGIGFGGPSRLLDGTIIICSIGFVSLRDVEKRPSIARCFISRVV
jgi:hypothetical protein